MSGQAETNGTNEARIVPVPAMVQIQTLLDAVTPEQIAGPIQGGEDDKDGCLVLGSLTDDMRRLCCARSQLKTAQEADIADLRKLMMHEEADKETERRFELLTESLESRKFFHGLMSHMLRYDLLEMFPELKDSVCHGHIFSDGTVGMHELPDVAHEGSTYVMLLCDLLGGGPGRMH